MAKIPGVSGAGPDWPSQPTGDTGTVSAPSSAKAHRPHLRTVQITTTNDDVFVAATHVERLPPSAFTRVGGQPVGLEGPAVRIVEDESVTQDDLPFANNPFSLPTPTSVGQFLFPNEERFPSLKTTTDALGQPLLDDQGRVQWGDVKVHLGQLVAFQAANETRKAAEQWAGRELPWGEEGQLQVHTHDLLDLNAFYSPVDRALHFGVVPYKDKQGVDRVFEMCSSWEVVAHESGHALHDVLKPTALPMEPGFRAWGESFGDQLAMWASLADPVRAREILAETGGDLSKPNALASMAELFGGVTGQTAPLRDARNHLKVSNTTEEFHDRSQVLTAAAYALFKRRFEDLRSQGQEPTSALMNAARDLGTFLTRTCDHTPEDVISLEDVAKAYLTVDQEYFGGRYHDDLAAELKRRGLLRKRSLTAWQDHRANVPPLKLAQRTDAGVRALVASNLEALRIPAGYGLEVVDYTVTADSRRVARLVLTDADGNEMANHGRLVFRADGSLADYLAPTEGITLEQNPADAVAALAPKGRVRLTAAGPEVNVIDAKHARVTRYSLAHPNGATKQLAQEPSSRPETIELLLARQAAR